MTDTSVTPTTVPTVPPSPTSVPVPPAETETVAKVAGVLVRAKGGASKLLTRFAVPVATGALTGLLVNAKRNRSENEDDDVVVDESND